jgi:hypothetical protein
MKWIKHDADANQDAKLQNVLLDYGLEGYGLYWYCIELIAGKVSKDCITFELEHDARIIARNTGSTPKKVEEIMTYFVDSGLFENSSGMITCMKLAKRLDKSMTSNPEMRNIIESLKLNSHDKVMTQSEKPMQDKIRLEENRVTNNDRSNDQSDVVEKAFEWFWANSWKPAKKLIGKVDTSPKSFNLEKRWKPLFNKKYFMTHTSEQFKAEVNAMAAFCKEAHNADRGRFENMQLARFLSEKQWRDL